jgi:uncharacterized protein (DUF1684 family)
MSKSVLLFLIVSVFWISCGTKQELGVAPLPSNYENELATFYSDRHESLTKPNGWMRIGGMYWLNEGVNSFGSDSSNSVVFPAGKISSVAGEFRVERDSVWMTPSSETQVYVDQITVEQEILLFPTEPELRAVSGDLEWYIIKRGDLMGIRMYNADNPLVDGFEGFPRYATDQNYYVKAELITEGVPDSIKIANILGQEEMTPSRGVLRFMIDGEEYRLTTLVGGERMFIIAGDLTNQDESYQAGRYLYVDMPPGGESVTTIDFNKMYNPPCAYSAFTTCQLPPVENRLDVRIEAGEKRPQPEYRPEVVYY